MSMIEVNEQNFEQEVLKADKPVLIDFNADWCGPCQAMLPVFEACAAEYQTISFCKVDVDEAPGIAAEFRVRNVPTVLFIKNGTAVDKSVGLVAKATLVEKLNALM